MLQGRQRIYISIIGKEDEINLHKILDILTPFNPTFTRLDIFGVVLYTFNFLIKDANKKKELEKVYKLLEKEVGG